MVMITHCNWQDTDLVCTNYTATQIEQIRATTTLTFFGIVPVIILLPWCCLRCRRWLKHRPSGKIAPGERYSDTPTIAKLVAAEQRAGLLRARTAGAIAQFGWAMTCIGMAAIVLEVSDNNLSLTFAGDIAFFIAPMNLGPAILCLAIRPVDVKLISGACRFMLVFYILFISYCAMMFIHDAARRRITFGLFGFLVGAINFAVNAVLLWPTVFSRSGNCCARSKMPPRRQLQRLWITLRLFILTDALIFAVLDKLDMAIDGSFEIIAKSRQKVGFIVFGVVGIISALALTPAKRGALHSFLGRLGKHDSKEQEAAAVAALIGGGAGGAAALFVRAQARFQALPVASLTKEELADNKPSLSLAAKASKATLGEVHAFVSHSWSDDGEAKFDRLHEYAEGFDGKAAAVHIWLDKACIDQSSITQSLECLPVFLAGCNDLLVLAGGTYHTRLWCVMELFVYLRMGGAHSSMLVRLLDDDDRDLAQLPAKFDAGKSQCFLDGDRQRLLAVIESSFGTFEPFNTIVRGILHDKLVGEASAK